MKKIPLTRGYEALVEEQDSESLSAYKWFVVFSRSTPYAIACDGSVNGKQRRVMMHRLIAKPEDGLLVDHINHNTIDNRRENLRVCTRSENCRNRKLGTPHSSKYKGVCLSQRGGEVKKWVAQITVNGRTRKIGRYVTEEDAARAYDEYAKKTFGSFALPNLKEV